MSNVEKCPLAGGNAPREIPEFCREHCEALWDKAVSAYKTEGNYDIYRTVEDFDEDVLGCNHENTELTYCSDGLQSADHTPKRFYTIVDQCIECEEEYGEQSYIYNCPNN